MNKLINYIFILSLFLVTGCYFIFVGSPKNESFKYYDSDFKSNNGVLKNGYYWFREVSTVDGRNYFGYYRFLEGGEIRFNNLGLDANISLDSISSYIKWLDSNSLKESLYGFYRINKDSILAQYVYENTAQWRNDFYESEMLIETDGKKIHILSEVNERTGKKEIFTRECQFHPY